MKRIAICAPGKRLERGRADAVLGLVCDDDRFELQFHQQCFERCGHFAGDDDTRLAALLECANDPAFDAVWFAMGGYGANRIAGAAIAGMGKAARNKAFLGYSDNGYLLAALYKNKIGIPVHAPLVGDIRRDGGADAIRRTLGWIGGDLSGLEPAIDNRPTVAFNLTTLAMLAGTDLMPDLTGHVVMVEETAEHLYAVDRLFFHITQHLGRIAGLRLGRISHVPKNDRPFGASAEEIARYWCGKSGIPFLGLADIGHDAANTIVPFGLAANATPA